MKFVEISIAILWLILWTMAVFMMGITFQNAGGGTAYDKGLMDGQKVQYEYYQQNGECK
jgi:hypothetical protein